MLELGFPLETRGENGATALHTAAYNGGADTVGLLLERGANIEARDTTWDSTPLEWAIVGSGERPASNPHANWVETVRTLLERGASTDGITANLDDPKPPSGEVAALFHACHLNVAAMTVRDLGSQHGRGGGAGSLCRGCRSRRHLV